MNDLHRDLCKHAARWLRRSKGCSVAFFEVVCHASEIADAVGFKSFVSYMIEVKTSRTDFLRDKKKRHRREPSQGIGNYRYYLCPEGIITPADLPPDWGLLYVDGKRLRTIVEPKKQPSNLFVERTLLTSVIRRTLSGCRHLSEKIL